MRPWNVLPLALAVFATAVHGEETPPNAGTQTLKLVPVAEDFDQPLGLATLPGELFVISERSGQMQVRFNGEQQQVGGLPDLYADDQNGLLDVIASPDFPDTGWLYFTYSSGDEDSTAVALARGQLAGNELTDIEELFEQNRRSEPGSRAGARLAWMADNTLLMSIGDRGSSERAQDTLDHAGKILRLDPQGAAPEDNPRHGEAGFLPEIYSWGHRHVLGLAVDPERNVVWAVEARNNGHDELLRIRGGENHGWPEAEESADPAGADLLDDAARGELFTDQEVIEPVHRFSSDMTPAGLAVINSEHYPDWQGDLLMGGLESGQLYRLDVSDPQNVEQETLLDESLGPVRDVRQGPDGYLYVLTGGDDSTLYRLEPQE
ncbi:MAG: PQQ-dependent sugar dehydrogenase [Halomonadaceae bacterium]|nr:PQQ-dependent sugar dehydrogenase [Halomonadaceae bacterium]